MNGERELPEGTHVPDADPTAPDVREGVKADPQDTSLPPEPQGEFP
jgi:hypothetical protein